MAATAACATIRSGGGEKRRANIFFKKGEKQKIRLLVQTVLHACYGNTTFHALCTRRWLDRASSAYASMITHAPVFLSIVICLQHHNTSRRVSCVWSCRRAPKLLLTHLGRAIAEVGVRFAVHTLLSVLLNDIYLAPGTQYIQFQKLYGWCAVFFSP